MFLCLLVAGASLCHAEVPQAQVVLNGSSFARGDFLSATFKLNSTITQPFTVFSVIIMPGGSMLDTMTLGPNIKPLASNVPSLAAPFTYPLISLNLPAGAPLGQYEVVVAFFDPSKPITGRQDAFLDVSGKFEIVSGNPSIPTPTPTPTQDWYSIYGPGGSGDVVKIGTMYVASKKDGQGCLYGDYPTNWVGALSWADGLNWLEKTDWRLPTKDELSAICAAKDTASGFTYRADYYWSSTAYDASLAWVVGFGPVCEVWNPNKLFTYQVRAVRDVEEP
jgi:hypothetical protein